MPVPFGSTGSQRFASAPAVGQQGATYYNTTEMREYVSNGTQWVLTGEGDGPFLAPVRLVTTGNHSLTGLAAIDSVTPVAGDRVGVFYQTTGSQNGIYTAASGAWTRAVDASAAVHMAKGTRVWSMEGTLNQWKEWTQLNTYATVGTDTAQFRVHTVVDSPNALSYPVPVGAGHMVWDTTAQILVAFDGFAWRPLNGVVTCTSSTRPSNPVNGNIIYETDTGLTYLRSGGAWVLVTSSASLATPPNRQIFTASGTWTKPAGALFVDIEVVGGGAAGGGTAAAAAGSHSVGSGGASGAYAKATQLATALGATETVTVGAAGAGVSGANGGNGTPSSFGSWASAVGGNGGLIATGSTAFGMVGGGIGAGTMAGDIQIPCEPGENSWGDAGFATGGNGGSSPLGAGGRGGAGSGTGQSLGGNGAGYGAGGGGSVNLNQAGTAQAGGSGAPGAVIVTTYFGPSSAGLTNPVYGTVTADDVVVAGDSLPRGVPPGTEGYAQITAGSATTALTTLQPVTGLAITPTTVAGRRYRLTMGATMVSSVANDRVAYGVVEGAGNTPIVTAQTGQLEIAASGHWQETTIYLTNPTAGLHTYKGAICRATGATGNIGILASAGIPAYVVIEDVGPA